MGVVSNFNTSQKINASSKTLNFSYNICVLREALAAAYASEMNNNMSSWYRECKSWFYRKNAKGYKTQFPKHKLTKIILKDSQRKNMFVFLAGRKWTQPHFLYCSKRSPPIIICIWASRYQSVLVCILLSKCHVLSSFGTCFSINKK